MPTLNWVNQKRNHFHPGRKPKKSCPEGNQKDYLEGLGKGRKGAEEIRFLYSTYELINMFTHKYMHICVCKYTHTPLPLSLKSIHKYIYLYTYIERNSLSLPYCFPWKTIETGNFFTKVHCILRYLNIFSQNDGVTTAWSPTYTLQDRLLSFCCSISSYAFIEKFLNGCINSHSLTNVN